ncbi:SRPBCC family protein [Sporocytophaga myxococcoides]|uniref:SRPBCC family protein n=1 Tax=Sporocytophaga myxococcoides TaxID=153721 RepID=UPI0003FBAD10|nr:SRPBCC domain-containing protein [Sporocytophaga myxococcoides]
MDTPDFTTSILVNQSPSEVYNAVNNVRGWWSEEIEGSTNKLNDVFMYHYKDVHISKMKLIEVIPNQKIVWLVLENHFNFTKDNSEWKDTNISFEITKKGNQTELKFTHIGLTSHYECYEICQEAWGNYIQNSLRKLIETGKGEPNPKEGGFNGEIVKKWKLQSN